MKRSLFFLLLTFTFLLSSCAYDDGTYDNWEYEGWGYTGGQYYDDYYAYDRPYYQGPRYYNRKSRGLASVRMRRGDNEFYHKCLRRNGVYRQTGCYCPGAEAFFNPFTHRCQDY